MRYIITLTEDGKREAFATDWFDAENDFNPDLQMTVVDVDMDRYMVDGKTWEELEVDHL